MLYAALLLSRQSRRPCGRDRWVSQTVRAVDWLVNHDYGIMSSVGVQTWELVTAAAVMRGANLRLVIPAYNQSAFDQACHNISHQFELPPARTEFFRLETCDDCNEKNIQRDRDRAVVDRADLLAPISVRADGIMAELLSAVETSGRPVFRDFETPYRTRREVLAYSIEPSLISTQLMAIDDEYLTHWSRASNGPWPDERRIDYFRDIVSVDQYPRTAFHTLTHMLTERRLIASPRHMPANTPVVSFTGLSPTQVVPLMRWRSRFGEMSFEPYGIGLRRSTAERLGIRPVRYYGESERRPVDADKWLTQSSGAKADWRQELEYRHRGDLELSAISPDDLMAFCLRPEESGQIQALFGIRAVPFYQ
jgi:hypothetical protein